MNKSLVLVSGAIVFKEQKGVDKWFLTKQGSDDEWEVPKVLVRKGESSVRAVLRMMGEKAGMTTRVLEEAGRAGGVTTTNNKTLPQRHIYYLMILKSGATEAIGFSDTLWLPYPNALKKLSSKREKGMLKQAKETLKLWRKKYQSRKHQ